MKTKSDQWRVTRDATATSARPFPFPRRAARLTCHPSPVTRHPFGFTLIELLVVISIIGVLAAFTIPVLKSVKASQYKKVAKAELARIEAELENYKAKYGVYPPGNQLTPSATYAPALFNQLYYELAGTTKNGNTFETLDGSASLSANEVKAAYGVDGFVNSTKGSGEDSQPAQNFLVEIKPNQINSYITNNNVRTTELVTSVGGPDKDYRPLGSHAEGINPFRYVYPGTHNPKSYDLWVQLVISGKTNLICNWSDQVQINQPLP